MGTLSYNLQSLLLSNLMTTFITTNPIAMWITHETLQIFIIFFIWSLHYPSTMFDMWKKAMV
jgi:hypothetical protein